MRDNIFVGNQYPKVFEFGDAVAEVFDDMVERSIPFYKEIVRQTAFFAKAYHISGTSIIDLGCSTSTVLLELREKHLPEAQLLGVDISPAMIQVSRNKMNLSSSGRSIELQEGDAMGVSFSGSSVVILNFLLPFLKFSERKVLLKNIYKGLPAGGAVLMSDKVRSSHGEIETSFVQGHDKFKLTKGYSTLEIDRKRESLQEVLVPLSFFDEFELLESAGFKAYDVFFKWNDFVSIVALKV